MAVSEQFAIRILTPFGARLGLGPGITVPFVLGVDRIVFVARRGR